jgi:hypothetical protein
MLYTVHTGRTHRCTDSPSLALEMAATSGEEAYVTAESCRVPGRPRIVWTPGMPAAVSPLATAVSRQ